MPYGLYPGECMWLTFYPRQLRGLSSPATTSYIAYSIASRTNPTAARAEPELRYKLYFEVLQQFLTVRKSYNMYVRSHRCRERFRFHYESRTFNRNMASTDELMNGHAMAHHAPCQNSQLIFNPDAGGKDFAARATDGGLANMVMRSVSMCDKVRTPCHNHTHIQSAGGLNIIYQA